MLVEGQVWFAAFVRMVRDFEILTLQPEKNFFRQVRVVFDKWSGGNGLMPGNECANALLELTGGGLWLKAVQQLFVNMRILAVFADGDSRAELEYATFKEKWTAYAGDKGFVEKIKIKFEAFVVGLERLDMVLKHETTLEMYREVDTTK